MFSELHSFNKVVLFSLIVCVLSSAALCALILAIADYYFPHRLLQSIIFGVILGAIVGFCKSFPIALIAFIPNDNELVWRKRVILILTAVLAVVEAWLYYELATFSFSFG